MKKQSLRLVAAIIWFLCAGAWVVSLCMDFAAEASAIQTVLHGVCLVASLAAGILQLMQYIRIRHGGEDDEKR